MYLCPFTNLPFINAICSLGDWFDGESGTMYGKDKAEHQDAQSNFAALYSELIQCNNVFSDGLQPPCSVVIVICGF